MHESFKKFEKGDVESLDYSWNNQIWLLVKYSHLQSHLILLSHLQSSLTLLVFFNAALSKLHLFVVNCSHF